MLADVKRQYYKNGGFVYTIRLVENKKIKASPIQRGQALLKNSGNALIDNTSASVNLSKKEIVSAKAEQKESVSSNSIAHNSDFVNREILDKNQDRVSAENSFSNRSLLANALESVAANDVERKKLAEYPKCIEE